MGKHRIGNYWSIFDLIVKKDKLEKMLLKETDIEKKELIEEDIELINEYIYSVEQEKTIYLTPSYLDLYNEMKHSYGKIKYLWKDFKEFGTNYNSNNEDIYVPLLKKSSLSKDDLLDLTHDFYNNAMNHYFYGNFMKNFYRNKDHLRFDSDFKKYAGFGETLSISSLNESYIMINRNYTIDDLFTIVHEYMHATSMAINPNNNNYNKKMFVEIESLFAEMIAADYFENIINNGDAKFSMYYNYDNYGYAAKTATNKINLLEKENQFGFYKSNKDLRKASKTLNMDDYEIDELFWEENNNPLYFNETYLISYLFAIELYEIYKKDKDKALHILKEIIKLEGLKSEQYYKTIKKMGLYPNLSICNYQNDLKNDVKKLVKRK